MNQPESRRLGLALGGGGGRGSSHIGVISVLEALNIPVDMIAGTSIGGVVGVLYAVGKTPDEIEELFRTATIRRIMTRDSNNYGLLGTAKIEAWLREILADRTFADLPFPVAVVTVDLVSGDEVLIQDGDLVEALLATSAVPGFFPPRPHGDHLLVDGMLRNNLPVDVAKMLGADKVIAVDLHEPKAQFQLASEPRSLWSPRSWVTLSQFAVLERSLNIMLQEIAEQRLAHCRPDLLIAPTLGSITPLDLTRAAEGRAAGAAAAAAEVAALEALGAWRRGEA